MCPRRRRSKLPPPPTGAISKKYNKKKVKDITPLSELEDAVKEFLDDNPDIVYSIETKYEEKIEKLKKKIISITADKKELIKENKVLKEKIKAMEDDYDRFDILDFGNGN